MLNIIELLEMFCDGTELSQQCLDYLIEKGAVHTFTIEGTRAYELTQEGKNLLRTFK